MFNTKSLREFRVTGNIEQGKVTGILISPVLGAITEPAAAAGVKSQAQNVCSQAEQHWDGAATW